MKCDWLEHMLIGAASLLAPGDRRAEWSREWHSELWYIPRPDATRFCLGAFQDALWLRRHNPSRTAGASVRLQSPLHCLGLLAVLAVAGAFATLRLPLPPPAPPASRLPLHDLPFGWLLMLAYSMALTPITLLTMGRASGQRLASSPNRLRRGLFLALKIALMQPIVLCGLFASLDMHASIAPMALVAAWILALRWAFLDQRRRCPVCLGLLTNPVRIGAPSQTFLEWYGAESLCSRGHGLLHSAEISASYSGPEQWLSLDGSWKELFPQSAGGRR